MASAAALVEGRAAVQDPAVVERRHRAGIEADPDLEPGIAAELVEPAERAINRGEAPRLDLEGLGEPRVEADLAQLALAPRGRSPGRARRSPRPGRGSESGSASRAAARRSWAPRDAGARPRRNRRRRWIRRRRPGSPGSERAENRAGTSRLSQVDVARQLDRRIGVAVAVGLVITSKTAPKLVSRSSEIRRATRSTSPLARARRTAASARRRATRPARRAAPGRRP